MTIVASATASFAQGPTDPYYLTAGANSQNVIINGSSASLFNQAGGSNGDEYAIAVSGGNIRTAGDGQTTPSSGAQYDLGFNATGTIYNGFAYDPNENNLFYDGTSNGSQNFVVSYGTSGEVYATNLDWTGMTPLFQAGGFGTNLGISYDSTNNSLWISGWNNSTITDYSMTGAVLSSFSTGMNDMTCLALDPGDGTLWFGSYLSSNYYQYSKSGTLLQSVFYSNLDGVNTLGGEFAAAPAPEPVTILMLGAGCAALLRRRTKA